MADPKTGTGKKPKGSGRRLYTDENPRDTVRIKFATPTDARKTVAKVKKISIIDKTWIMKLQLQNKKLHKYLIEKASISINGVSLTLSKVAENHFEINVIPHTLKLTNLNNLKRDDIVNVELDIFGKYIHKLSK